MGIARASVAAMLAVTSLAAAQLPRAAVPGSDVPRSDVPWNDVPTRVEGGEVVAARLGWPAPRVQSFDARRRSARDVGEERGRAALHAFVDDALARALVEPAEASRVHALVETHARRTRVRALADGCAVVEMRVQGAMLRQAADRPGLPW